MVWENEPKNSPSRPKAVSARCCQPLPPPAGFFKDCIISRNSNILASSLFSDSPTHFHPSITKAPEKLHVLHTLPGNPPGVKLLYLKQLALGQWQQSVIEGIMSQEGKVRAAALQVQQLETPWNIALKALKTARRSACEPPSLFQETGRVSEG